MKKHSVWYVILPLTNGLVDMLSPTIKNIYKDLTRMEYLLQTLRITKSYGSKEYFVVHDWIKISERIGFKHVKTIKMMLNTRPV